jgi:hypothetical protein
LSLLVLLMLGSWAGSALAQDSTATFHLDAGSHISFSSTETLPVPAGSTIRFHFGAPRADGSIPITVRPEDLAIAPIPVAQGAAIAYTLAEPATGTLHTSAEGRAVDLDATLVATLRGRPEVPATVYPLRFTTGRVEASDAAASESVVVDGSALATRSRSMVLVGAATNAPDAFPGAGAAVIAVLSGAFDGLPGEQ